MSRSKTREDRRPVSSTSHVIMRLGLTPVLLTAPKGHGIPLVDECAVSG